MPLSRRSALLLLPAALLALPPARAADDPRTAPRALGSPAAPVTVTEYFSLTCPHCARFSQETFPQVQKQLIDTGKLRYVFVDYPLDQVAMMAAQVARTLPPDRYVPFIDALFASQDRWAYDPNVNSTDELAKMAALAGLSRPQFDAAIKDTALENAIGARQEADTKTYGIDSTPTFIFDGPGAHNLKQSGEMTYDEFAKLVAKAGGPTG